MAGRSIYNVRKVALPSTCVRTKQASPSSHPCHGVAASSSGVVMAAESQPEIRHCMHDWVLRLFNSMQVLLLSLWASQFNFSSFPNAGTALCKHQHPNKETRNNQNEFVINKFHPISLVFSDDKAKALVGGKETAGLRALTPGRFLTLPHFPGTGQGNRVWITWPTWGQKRTENWTYFKLGDGIKLGRHAGES